MGSPLADYCRMRRLYLTYHYPQRLECSRLDYRALPPTSAMGAALGRPAPTARRMTRSFYAVQNSRDCGAPSTVTGRQCDWSGTRPLMLVFADAGSERGILERRITRRRRRHRRVPSRRPRLRPKVCAVLSLPANEARRQARSIQGLLNSADRLW
jgi:hypothetical protein